MRENAHTLSNFRVPSGAVLCCRGLLSTLPTIPRDLLGPPHHPFLFRISLLRAGHGKACPDAAPSAIPDYQPLPLPSLSHSRKD